MTKSPTVNVAVKDRFATTGTMANIPHTDMTEADIEQYLRSFDWNPFGGHYRVVTFMSNFGCVYVSREAGLYRGGKHGRKTLWQAGYTVDNGELVTDHQNVGSCAKRVFNLLLEHEEAIRHYGEEHSAWEKEFDNAHGVLKAHGRKYVESGMAKESKSLQGAKRIRDHLPEVYSDLTPFRPTE